VSLRVAAGLALALGAGALLVFLALVGAGPLATPAARHLRAMKRRLAAPATVVPMDRARLAALPRTRPDAATARLEARGAVVEGWVQNMLLAADGDIHLELAGRPPSREGTSDYVTAEITPAGRARHPGWRYAALAEALRPSRGSGPWPDGPRRARLTGWLLYDHEFDRPGHTPRPTGAGPRGTVWEVHPVTRVEVFDEARGTWTEVGP
jgi:hypothetical protein